MPSGFNSSYEPESTGVDGDVLAGDRMRRGRLSSRAKPDPMREVELLPVR
jgi:hypothetical protein